MVILLNTFASPIICGLALPMLLITNKRHPTNTDADAQQSNAQDGSEIDVLENKNRSFLDLYRIAVTYLGLFMLKVCCLTRLKKLKLSFIRFLNCYPVYSISI